MDKSKVDFISDLLTHKHISVTEKERLFLLTKDEIQKLGEFDNDRTKEILERIEKLEQDKRDTTFSLIATESLEDPIKKTFEKPHKPKDVADFMSLFNRRDGLKYLTHDFDEEEKFSINELLKIAKNVFDKKTKELSIPINLFAIINQFAFSKNPKWTSYNSNYNPIAIQDGWSTDKWINWSTETNFHPMRNPDYETVINDFRKLTRIEAPFLDSMIKDIVGDIFNKEDENIECIDLRKADFYTHVPSFRIGMMTILKEIKKRIDSEDKNRVKIQYKRDIDGEYFLRKLIITHYNSYPDKELNVLCKEWQSDKGAMGDIKNKLFGYCDWFVETKVENRAMRINILRDKNMEEYEEIDETDILGFTHILTFYYR